jgi:arylsulfatase A-like enzyme
MKDGLKGSGCWVLMAALGIPFSSLAATPNVVVILVDDVGWGEFGFQGNKQIPTPHIDSIAQQGIRCSCGYVSGCYCSPTRAGLMTGRYQNRFGHEFNTITLESGLSLKETTMADRLKRAGYATIAIGKWHLGDRRSFQPLERGFQEFYGTLGNTTYYHPIKFVDTRVAMDILPMGSVDFYTTGKYAERAVEFLEANKAKPFFLYLPFNAQHAPLQAPLKYLKRFADISDPKRQTFSAMMAALDDAVGAVLQKIRDIGQEENTLIFFLSDNGGPTPVTTSSNGPLRGYKAQTWEGGIRVPFAIQWKGHLPAGKVFDQPVIQLDILPTAMAAAGISPTPQDQLEGVDLLPYLRGERSDAPHESLYWRFGPQWAVRHGDYKLVVGRDGSGSPELYNLKTDVGEQQNLAEMEPQKVVQLQGLWDEWNASNIPAASSQERPRKRGGGPRRRQPQRAEES